MGDSTRLERIVCAMVAGAAATEVGSETWANNEAFAKFVVGRALAVEAALNAAENVGTKPAVASTLLMTEVELPSFKADPGRTWRSRAVSTFVYFIQTESGTIKIGQSLDINGRMQSLQRSSGEMMRLVGWIHDTNVIKTPLETKLHRRFAKARVMGEWFRPVPELIEYIEKEARPAPCAT